jgi:hypothetical protein
MFPSIEKLHLADLVICCVLLKESGLAIVEGFFFSWD